MIAISQTDYRCMEGKVKCLDGIQCINKDYMCDADVDCSDGSDEETCPGDLIILFKTL